MRLNLAPCRMPGVRLTISSILRLQKALKNVFCQQWIWLIKNLASARLHLRIWRSCGITTDKYEYHWRVILSIESITWWDVRIIGGVIENLDIYQLTKTTAIYSSFTQNCNVDNMRTFGGYNGIFFMALATGTQGDNFEGASNNACRLETRFIGPVAEKDTIGTFIFFTQCGFVTSNVDCVANHVPSVFFEKCYFFYNNQAGLYCANLNIRLLNFTVFNASNCNFDSSLSSSIPCLGGY